MQRYSSYSASSALKLGDHGGKIPITTKQNEISKILPHSPSLTDNLDVHIPLDDTVKLLCFLAYDSPSMVYKMIHHTLERCILSFRTHTSEVVLTDVISFLLKHTSNQRIVRTKATGFEAFVEVRSVYEDNN